MTPAPFAQSRSSASGRLDQAARAVSHQRIGADCAAMVEVYKELETLGDDVVGFFAPDVGDKADAARVMLVAGVIKTLFCRLP